jgi:hypothetical protein
MLPIQSEARTNPTATSATPSATGSHLRITYGTDGMLPPRTLSVWAWEEPPGRMFRAAHVVKNVD